MLTKGNDAKVQNEVMVQIVTDTSAKWMKFTRLLPKQEIEENSQYYTYMSQRVNIEEAIQSGVLGEAKDIAPGATLQELNVRTNLRNYQYRHYRWSIERFCPNAWFQFNKC